MSGSSVRGLTIHLTLWWAPLPSQGTVQAQRWIALFLLDMEAHSCNLNAQEDETGGPS